MSMSEPGEALAQLALLGEAVSNARGVAVFVFDEDRNYVAVNEEACRLTGRTRAELLSMRTGDMSPSRAEPHFTEIQRRPLLHGGHAIDRDDGSVELEWVTCRTEIAGLPYFVSVCWRREADG
jgi:PAS domain S-box-containing protein